MIDRPLQAIAPPLSMQMEDVELSAPAALDETAYEISEPDEDGMVELLLPDAKQGARSIPFDGNLAVLLDDTQRQKIAAKVIEDYDDDDNSRREWKDGIAEALKTLGLKNEDREMPFRGASGVHAPLTLQSLIEFQSSAIMEIYPPTGPVGTKTIGKVSKEIQDQADRIREDMNKVLLSGMPGHRKNMERLLWSLGFLGSAFKKVYPDPVYKRPVSLFIDARDFVIQYGATDLDTAERFSHRFDLSPAALKQQQESGWFMEEEILPGMVQPGVIKQRVDEIQGQAPPPAQSGHTIIEMHCMMVMPDGIDAAEEVSAEDEQEREKNAVPLPYCITVEKESSKLLAIRRGWAEDDPTHRRVAYFVDYTLVPAFGIYGFGYAHILASTQKAITGLGRQIIDSGTYANLPAGLKTKGMRIDAGEQTFNPGEFKDANVAAGTIRDNLYQFQFQGPSPVTLQMMDTMQTAGERLSFALNMKSSDMNTEAPVGTTLALIEKAAKVMTAVHARLHTSFNQELQMIKKVIMDLGEPYDYDVEGVPRDARPMDYAAVQVVPISDPTSSSLAQRIMVMQAVFQLIAQAPQVYDLKVAHREFLKVLGVKTVDKLIPDDTDIGPMEPVLENQRLLSGKPVKAFQYQDHEAHIRVHMAFMQDPQLQQILQGDAQAPLLLAAAQTHVREHAGMAYRRKMEEALGVPIPSETLPEDIEADFSSALADAGDRVLGISKTAVAAQQAQQAAQDPVVQQAAQELQLKAQGLAQKAQSDQAKLALDHRKEDDKVAIENRRLEQQRRQDAEENRLKAAALLVDARKPKGGQGG